MTSPAWWCERPANRAEPTILSRDQRSDRSRGATPQGTQNARRRRAQNVRAAVENEDRAVAFGVLPSRGGGDGGEDFLGEDCDQEQGGSGGDEGGSEAEGFGECAAEGGAEGDDAPGDGSVGGVHSAEQAAGG